MDGPGRNPDNRSTTARRTERDIMSIKVTYAEMHSAATRLSAGEEDLKTKLTELQGIVSQLVNEGFSTEAASGAFKDAYDKFTTGAQQAVGGIDGMVQFINKAAEALQQTDQGLAQAVSGS
jgi:WXG100 family type VII secretion target